MKPTSTIYRLARAGGEFNKLYALAKKQGLSLPAGTLNFPTVLAERDGKVLGFLSTLPTTEAVLAGPLVMGQKSMLTAIRIAEAYEVVLRTAGVDTYFIQIDPARAEWSDTLERLGYELMNTNEERILLRREL